MVEKFLNNLHFSIQGVIEHNGSFNRIGGLIFMEKVPTLRELLNSKEENHANHIIVSTNKNKDLFKGDS